MWCNSSMAECSPETLDLKTKNEKSDGDGDGDGEFNSTRSIELGIICTLRPVVAVPWRISGCVGQKIAGRWWTSRVYRDWGQRRGVSRVQALGSCILTHGFATSEWVAQWSVHLERSVLGVSLSRKWWLGRWGKEVKTNQGFWVFLWKWSDLQDRTQSHYPFSKLATLMETVVRKIYIYIFLVGEGGVFWGELWDG